MVGVILATDMASHMQDLGAVKRKIEQTGISKELQNAYLFINRTSESTLFDSQQQLLEIC